MPLLLFLILSYFPFSLSVGHWLLILKSLNPLNCQCHELPIPSLSAQPYQGSLPVTFPSGQQSLTVGPCFLCNQMELNFSMAHMLADVCQPDTVILEDETSTEKMPPTRLGCG